MPGPNDRRRKELENAISSLPLVLKELVSDATRLSWTIQLGRGGILSLHSPLPHNVTVVIPRGERSIQEKKLRAWNKKVVRYGDPFRYNEQDRAMLELPDEPDDIPTPAEIQAQVEAQTEHLQAQEAAQEPDSAPVAPDVQGDDSGAPRAAWKGERTCTLCDPPTVWPNANALSAHKTVHKPKALRRRRGTNRSGGKYPKKVRTQCQICLEWFPSGHHKGQHVRWNHPYGKNGLRQIRRGVDAVTPEEQAQVAKEDHAQEADMGTALQMIIELAQEALGESPSGDPGEVERLTEEVEKLSKELDQVRQELAERKEQLSKLIGL